MFLVKLKAFEAHYSCGHFAPNNIKNAPVRKKNIPEKPRGEHLIMSHSLAGCFDPFHTLLAALGRVQAENPDTRVVRALHRNEE